MSVFCKLGVPVQVQNLLHVDLINLENVFSSLSIRIEEFWEWRVFKLQNRSCVAFCVWANNFVICKGFFFLRMESQIFFMPQPGMVVVLKMMYSNIVLRCEMRVFKLQNRSCVAFCVWANNFVICKGFFFLRMESQIFFMPQAGMVVVLKMMYSNIVLRCEMTLPTDIKCSHKKEIVHLPLYMPLRRLKGLWSLL